ncbi:MAG TPA: alcohol dehydrogenase catalytic domain-containing protein, partial [Planctomycetota bacterium]|nr:alcohol dehydrogenase catalytic domain-containing protein [Planctomycetota bacterium]
MKALVFDGQLKLVEDYPDPEPAPGEALVRVTVAGICNTDVEITRGYMDFRGIPGHEFVGVVAEAKDDRWLGKRVVGEINLPCGDCPTCAAGLPNHCPDRRVLGISGHPGAFAGFLTLPTANLHGVPEGIADDEAVFVEPLAAACQITRQIDVVPDARVCILGDGKLGLLVVQVLAPLAARTTLVGKSVDKMNRLDLPDLERVLADD